MDIKLNGPDGRKDLKGTDGAAHVLGPDQLPAGLDTRVIRDHTTTRQKQEYPSGALWVLVVYRLLPGATAVTNQFLKLVTNATEDADADGKLATDGAFVPLFQGHDGIVLVGSRENPITRIDTITEQAVGSEKTVVSIIAGVIE